MTIFKTNSLSGYIIRFLSVFAVLFLVMAFAILNDAKWSPWNLGIALVVLAITLLMLIWEFKNKVLSSFDRALLHIEAIKVEDYNQIYKSDFKAGVTADVHQELAQLSKHLQAHKSQYDQHALLLYQLIDQLDTPILVFNQRQVLSYANGAFSMLFGEPWQVYRQASPKLLGLEKSNGEWRLCRSNQQWQINQSEFIDAGERHQLLVFTNIDSALRASQLEAWQQIIRVLGHEIRNSLTPVSSLAESLAPKLESPRDKQALEVIAERCTHLQVFVNRYSSLSQNLNLDIQPIDLSVLQQQLNSLFEHKQLEFSLAIDTLNADPVFFQQVLINLIKNAFEADATEVKVRISTQGNRVIISVIDNGHGLANTENLFVPLYTTKQQGQGIGLTFCRNIIEQHKGTIVAKNNPGSRPGARIDISLPTS